MQERIILFDLDGTLTDSGPGIMKASQFALHAYGVERDWQELDFFVGPPLDETFGQFMPKEDIPGAIDQFRVYYHDVGWLENEPYPGVREMLDTLQKTAFGCLWQPRSSRAWPCRCWGISAWRRILKRSAARRAIIRKREKR